jgi:hypothetical protein
MGDEKVNKVFDDEVLIHENSLYKVVLGPPTLSNEPSEANSLYSTRYTPRVSSDRVYKIINKQYNLVEMESTILMRALYNADDFEAHVTSHAQMQLDEETLQ